jgi:hypothetical protein
MQTAKHREATVSMNIFGDRIHARFYLCRRPFLSLAILRRIAKVPTRERALELATLSFRTTIIFRFRAIRTLSHHPLR